MSTKNIHRKIAIIVWCIDPEDNRRYLLRHNKPFDGYEDEWTVVFGSLENNEDQTKAVIRELKEEFYINKFKGLNQLNYKSEYQGKHGNTEVFWWSAQVENIDIKVILNEESIGYDWVLEKDLDKYVKKQDELKAFTYLNNFQDNQTSNLAKDSFNKLMIFCDGGARGNPGPAASGFAVLDEDGEVIHEGGKYLGKATNNVAEYQAVILALEWVNNSMTKLPNYKITINLDSELLYKQIIGEYKVKAEHLKGLNMQIKNLIEQLKSRGVQISWQHQLREHNKTADKIVNQILDEHK